MLRGRASGGEVARYAVAAAVAAVVATIAVLAVSYLGGDRPEEEVARDFLTAFLRGDGARAYDLTTPSYRSLVLRDELTALSEEVSEVAGDDPTLQILGSERTPGSQPPESLVGYTADTAAGPAEGVVTLFEVEGSWLVADVGYRFTDAPPERLEELRRLTRRLNEQVEERARRLSGTPQAPPRTTPGTPD